MIAKKAKVRVETDYVYTNKFSGKQIRFTPKPDEVVATFQPQPDAQATRKALTALPLPISQGMNVERGFAVFRVAPGQEPQTAKRALTATALVANAMPALIDDQGLTRYCLPDEVTVQFQQDVSKQKAERIIKEQGCQIVTRQRTPGYYTLAVPEGRGMFEMIREFSALEEVAFAEPSEAGFNLGHYVPDDPQFATLWALRNTGQTVNGTAGTADADIDVTEAWDLTRGNPNVIIAVIDTGVDLDHPDLAANLLPRNNEDWDFAALFDRSPDDGVGHGTHVAGTIAAVDNTSGVIGVAPQCRIMPLRINLEGGLFSHAADAINYVADQAAAQANRRYVINGSWGGGGDIAAIHNAIQRAVNRNVVAVFSAGNDSQNIDQTPKFPAAYSEVIAVAATNQQDQKASFSNFGAKVDVSAPGVNIFSTVPNNTFDFKNGTSMASPHVAGLAALVWSLNSNLTNHEVRAIVQNTCDNIDAKNSGFAGKLGKGRINAFRAVAAALFSLRTIPGELRLVRSSSGTASVSLRRAPGFTGPVALAVQSLPSGVSASFNPTSITGNSSSTLTVTTGNVANGSYSLVLRGTKGNVTNSAVLTLKVKDFFISISNPAPMLEAGGSSVSITVTIHRSPGFNNNVSLSVEGLPQGGPQGGGVTAFFEPVATTGNTSTLKLKAGRFAESASYNLTIRATSGNLVDTVLLGVEVVGNELPQPI